MSRRITSQPTGLNENVGELLKGTNEAGKLGSILDLIKQQQQDLKGYIDRIESAIKDLEGLELRKVNAIKEVSKIEDANETLRSRLESGLKTLYEDIATAEKELEALKTRTDLESLSAEEKVKKLQTGIDEGQVRFDASVKQHQKEYKLLLEEQDLIKSNIELLNEGLLKIQGENIEESKILATTTSNKDAVLKEIGELHKGKTDLESQVNEIASNLKELKEKSHELESKNEQIVKDGIAKFKELEAQSQKELLDIEKEKASKNVELKKVKDSLTDFNSKLESVKGEYDKVTGEIAGFISKKSEVDRKEERIKEQYKKAGLNY